jgi:ABC-2 type transport system permease protein
VSRDEFLAGKFAGGYMLLAMVILLNAVLSLASATLTFGGQMALGVIPAVVVAQVFSAVVFYSVAFMSGELVRRSSLSYVLASAVYFVSEIAGIYLRVIFELTGNDFYQHINFYLPTTPGSSLPLLIAQPALPPAASTVLQFVGIGATETSIPFCIGLISAYALGAIIFARWHFVSVDVSKRVA